MDSGFAGKSPRPGMTRVDHTESVLCRNRRSSRPDADMPLPPPPLPTLVRGPTGQDAANAAAWVRDVADVTRAQGDVDGHPRLTRRFTDIDPDVVAVG